jgi:hypothetical protein
MVAWSAVVVVETGRGAAGSDIAGAGGVDIAGRCSGSGVPGRPGVVG